MLAAVSRTVLTLTLLCLTTLLARPASAQVWVDVNELDGKVPSWVDEKYVPAPTPRREPEYRRVWVEPVYRITCKRIWVPPVVRIVYERIWVPARYEIRETVCWENGVKVIRRERICVEPGHYELVRREIAVSPGCWRMAETKDLVSGGYWKLEPA